MTFSDKLDALEDDIFQLNLEAMGDPARLRGLMLRLAAGAGSVALCMREERCQLMDEIYKEADAAYEALLKGWREDAKRIVASKRQRESFIESGNEMVERQREDVNNRNPRGSAADR